MLRFQKNRFNIFQATSEPATIEYKGEWEKNLQTLKEVLYVTYTNQGIAVDTSSTKDKIGGLSFDVFRVTIYSTEGDVIMKQDMYSRYRNGYDFGVNISYNNEVDKNEMMRAWRGSKFIKNISAKN